MKLGQVARILLIIFLLIGFLIINTPRTFAADDSNSGGLTQSSTVNSQLLSSSIANLTEELNNTQVGQLTSQLESQLNTGNTAGAGQTLTQLQSLLNTQSGSQGVPSSLSSLLQSLSAGPNGISVDPNQLSNLLGLDSSNGLPSNMSNQSPTSSAQALQTLSTLLKNINPALAQQMLSEASALIQSNGTNPGLSTPTLSSKPSLPTISPPSLGITPSAKLPSINAESLVIPIVVIAAAISLFLFRNRFAAAIGRQILPRFTKPLDLMTDLKYDPNDPKSRIYYAFARAVGAMRLKGFEKYIFESHREFAKKCLLSVESSHVSAITDLYEKAKFSGVPVSMGEADIATKELSSIEVSKN
jgi:hypothetical protein